MITAAAGTGSTGFSVDGGLAINAELGGPTALTFDAKGSLYVADAGNYRVLQSGGYVPVRLFVGQGPTVARAAWIAVASNNR